MQHHHLQYGALGSRSHRPAEWEFLDYSHPSNAVMLILTPMGIVSHFAGWSGTVTFVLNFLCCIPLSCMMARVAQQVAHYTGLRVCVFRSSDHCAFAHVRAVMLVGVDLDLCVREYRCAGEFACVFVCEWRLWCDGRRVQHTHI